MHDFRRVSRDPDVTTELKGKVVRVTEPGKVASYCLDQRGKRWLVSNDVLEELDGSGRELVASSSEVIGAWGQG